MELSRITGQIVDSAIQVHSELGPGLLESACETCLAAELQSRGLRVEKQLALPIIYKGTKVDAGYRIDLLVEGEIIVELKAVESILPLHEAQLLSYLKLSNKKYGLLLNFNVKLMKNGIRRLAN